MEKITDTTLAQVLNIPNHLIQEELEGLYGSNVLADMRQVIGLYNTYESGAEFPLESSGDSVPADLKFQKASALLDKEVRFLFSRTPDFYIDPVVVSDNQNMERTKENISIYQKLVNSVLEKNFFGDALLKAAKDCFIGKRVALMFNINDDSGIQISFMPSLEFVYDVDHNNSNIITKITAFYGLNDEKAKDAQRIYKKRYWMEGGLAHYSETLYNGLGKELEVITPPTPTKLPFIPAFVIVNDGLTGDLLGKSEIDILQDLEGWYSRLGSADIDAERKGMNPIRYTVDASPESTQNLSISAGAFWDLSTDQNQSLEMPAQVGVLDSPMTYSPALGATLDRISNMMHERSAVPNVSPEALQGVVSSGKTLKAIYWDLIVRCDEKMLTWRPALEFMVKCIIEGGRLYPQAIKQYIEEALPQEPYSVRVDNQYPLPEDEAEEKQIDLAEVNAQTMSKKAYMKKWRQLTDEEADEELKQIAKERELLEDSFMGPQMPPMGAKKPEDEEEEEE